jgi:hypothetical protein
MKNTHRIDLILGDPSGDGHGKSQTVVINSSLSRGELLAAYQVGRFIVGFDFINEVCKEYEDCRMKREYKTKLLELGFFDFYEDGLEEDTCYLDQELFAQIFLFICKLGDTLFEYQIVESNSYINIGGYGLFGS